MVFLKFKFAMQGYRVTFKDNIPQTANLVEEVDNQHIVQISDDHGHKCMNWLVVPGNSENDALSIAEQMMSTIWCLYLKNCNDNK